LWVSTTRHGHLQSIQPSHRLHSSLSRWAIRQQRCSWAASRAMKAGPGRFALTVSCMCESRRRIHGSQAEMRRWNACQLMNASGCLPGDVAAETRDENQGNAAFLGQALWPAGKLGVRSCSRRWKKTRTASWSERSVSPQIGTTNGLFLILSAGRVSCTEELQQAIRVAMEVISAGTESRLGVQGIRTIGG